MANLEAVDAKVERARGQLRRLRDEVAHFCRERSRLILPEQCGDRQVWVYRGGEAALPVRWSVRAGEFAHNLRSALDHLVWQLATVHGQCAGRHGDTPCPGRHSEFPIRVRRDPGRLDIQLCGVGPVARAYIESVQPPRRFREFHAPNGNRVGVGLGMLRDLCNQDKHQSCLKAHARWTGEWPTVCQRDSSGRSPRAEEYADQWPARMVEIVGHELRYGKALLITTGWPIGQRLKFPVNAYFDHLPYARVGTGQNVSVGETLDACMDSVEMVLNRLQQEL